MTAPRMSLRITTQRGAQLAAFAKARGFNHSEAIGALIDHAQKTGLTEPLAFPGVEIGVTNDGTVAITLNHLQLSLTFAQGRSLASSVRRVATTPCSAVLDIDAGTIEIRRISERQAVQNETLKNVNENVRETKEAVESLKGDRYKYLVGFVLTIGSVLLTYFLDHSDAIARTTGH